MVHDDRQVNAFGHILEHGSLTIQDFEGLCPDVNCRSLQRDLKAMIDMVLLVSEGATNKLVYRMRGVAAELATILRHNLRQTHDSTCDSRFG